jgi:TonB family protein
MLAGRGTRVSLAVAALLSLAVPAAAQPAPPAPPAAITPPRPLHALSADYPPGARGDVLVVLTVTVNADGSVRGAQAAEGTPEPFASVAVAAASEWRFAPAARGGKPISAKIRAEIQFTAPPEPAPPAAPPASGAKREPPPSGAPEPPPVPLEVTVRGESPAPGVQSFSRAEVRLLPGAFGDPFRAVETLPGVTPMASGVPFFYVRGAPPGNVGYFLDGIRVPLLYHLGLGPSVVHPAIVDRVDLYPGGYPARFGRFAGGVVAGETRDPAAEWHGEGSIRAVDAGAMVEGPLGERGSFFASGRVSYTGLLLSAFSSNLRLNYWDYGARGVVHLGPKDDLTLFAFGAYDYLGQKDELTKITQTLFDTTFHRVDLRWDHRFASSPEDRLRAAVTFGYDHTGFDPSEQARYIADRLHRPVPEPGVRDRSGAARLELVRRLSNAVLLRAGADVTVDSYAAQDLGQAFDNAAAFTTLFSDHVELAAGARADLVIDVTPRLEVTPGLRLDFYASKGETAVAVEPRLAARYAVTPALRLLTAHGFASQPPSFLVAGPGFQLGLTGGLQHSFQSSLGLEADLPLDVTAAATVFRDAFFNMTDALGTHQVPGNGDSFPSDFTSRSTGSSVGLELTLRRRLTKRLGGFVSYTLSRSERILPHEKTLSTFDRTHVFNAAVSWDLTRGYRLGSRLVFYTGYPHPVLGRLPPFFRFDWRAEKKWRVAKGWVSLVLEVQNSMLAKETLQSSCVGAVCTPVSIGPVTIPSLGVEGGF